MASEPGENGATALVPGTHWSPIDPRWDTLFETPFRLSKDPAKSGLSFFLNWNIFNNIFRARSFKKVTGAFGKQGDVYFFPNGEVWHGRLPNMHGRRTMICLMGCSATTQESAQRPLETSKEVLSCLPARLAQGLGGPFEVNDATGTLIDHLYKTRGPASLFSLERWAKLERRFAEWFSAQIRALSAYSGQAMLNLVLGLNVKTSVSRWRSGDAGMPDACRQ